jgi:kynureninase
MYVRPDLLKTLKPRITGWFAHQRPFTFDFEALDLREDRYRLANGTPPIAALYCGFSLALRSSLRWGVATIRANSIRQTELLIALADAIGCKVFSPRDAGRARRGRSLCSHRTLTRSAVRCWRGRS